VSATSDWFERQTFDHRRFADLLALLEAKESQDLSVSACIPALNEAATIGPIIETIRDELMDRCALVDELVVMDSRSTDATARIAEDAGAMVVQDDEVVPSLEPAAGKGEAMWKSLFVLKGDLIVWLDADIENFHPRFVYGTLGPLLTDPTISYAKAFYDRPLRIGDQIRPSEGGRVTEIMARPLLNMFWPELAGVIQPLSGEYAGRRGLLEQLPFFTGYGVEIGMMIDVADRFGVDVIAQVDLERRDHRNRSVHELTRMASAILQTAMTRLAGSGRLSPDTIRTSLIQVVRENDHIATKGTEIRVQERPPAASVPEYHSR
jgi:glycosyltransferase involved in cell wall biosynthesis